MKGNYSAYLPIVDVFLLHIFSQCTVV